MATFDVAPIPVIIDVVTSDGRQLRSMREPALAIQVGDGFVIDEERYVVVARDFEIINDEGRYHGRVKRMTLTVRPPEPT